MDRAGHIWGALGEGCPGGGSPYKAHTLLCAKAQVQAPEPQMGMLSGGSFTSDGEVLWQLSPSLFLIF